MMSLDHIPLPLRIKILYKDDDIIVVSKPPHLRTVPGNATEATQTNSTIPKLTASQAWKQVLQNYANNIRTSHNNNNNDSADDDDIDLFLYEIAKDQNYAKCLPHKWKSFQSFVLRNWTKHGATIFPLPPLSDDINDEDDQKKKKRRMKIKTDILPRIFQRLCMAQRRLLPETTTLEESVLGQLTLYFREPNTTATNSSFTTIPNLHIVHRLDCATSGVLVVARTSVAAAALCHAWRERDQVSKVYYARVCQPPPLLLSSSSSSSSLSEDNDHPWNTISDPMKPSTERLKWQITTKDDPNGKSCLTLWKRTKYLDCLELKPVTGRTHQLRVHCQAHFGGIVGDTLYGSNTKTNYLDKEKEEERLYLHAYELSFPHPKSGKQVSFQEDPDWFL